METVCLHSNLDADGQTIF